MGVLSRGNGRGIKTTVAKFLGTPSGANLLAALTTKTGTGLPVFSNNALMVSPQEVVTLYSALGATGTVTLDVLTQSVLYYSTNATANFTLNIRGDGSTTLNSLMSVGNSITVAFMNANGATPYYPNVISIDGTTVTPKIQGGTAITSGNASSIDVYTLAIIKTAANTYTVLEAQTKFA